MIQPATEQAVEKRLRLATQRSNLPQNAHLSHINDSFSTSFALSYLRS
jgi:hypothetical protein